MPSASSNTGTVGKALWVLELVAEQGQPVRFSDLISAAPYPKATLYRLLQTLVADGLLEFDVETGLYSLGMRLVKLAHAAWSQSSLAPIARPYLDALSQEAGITVHLAQLESAQVLYVDKRVAKQPVQMFSQAGKVGPAYCTGVGKAMLAHLPESDLDRVLSQQSWHVFTEHTIVSPDQMRVELSKIRHQGYALDQEEHEPGIICVATAVLSRRGRVLGAISLTTTTLQMDLDALIKWVPRMQTIAHKIAMETESWRFPESAHSSMPKGVHA